MEDAGFKVPVVHRTIEKHVKTHIVTCTTAKEMYDTLKQIYQRDTSQQQCLVLQDFYNFKYDKIKDMMTNISHVQNIAFKLRQLNQNVDESMIMIKITTILPKDYKRFSTAWDSTATVDRTLDNLVARLMFEEVKCKMTTKEEESVAFKTVTKTKSKSHFKCFNCNQIGDVQINCPNKGKRNCSICKRNNHSEKDCYFRNKDSDTRKQCTVCKKTNHAEKDCYFKDRNKRSKVNFLAEAAETHVSDANEKDKMYEVDSGSTCHMTNVKTDLIHTKHYTQCIKVAKKNQSMTAKEIGSFEFKECSLKNVSYVPELIKNLLSVQCITENDGEVLFTKEKVQIFKDKNVVIEGKKDENELFVINLTVMNEAMMTQQDINVEWHRKLGHISYVNLGKLREICQGIPESVSKCKSVDTCSVCMQAKQVRLPFDTERSKAGRPLEIIHSDVCGPTDPTT
ncbi:hypothetical protein B7P43_G15692 [Cryptotermes secundus]|uniref:CCHC-type domain-containing protein n=1 Tax=Cryptotermes secundus TaxID=105785 RepID=A0A2J7RGM6_9NEOP|nr:hypothetical protein B7P43_G15692 [Cryptotermes secundus]